MGERETVHSDSLKNKKNLSETTISRIYSIVKRNVQFKPLQLCNGLAGINTERIKLNLCHYVSDTKLAMLTFMTMSAINSYLNTLLLHGVPYQTFLSVVLCLHDE